MIEWLEHIDQQLFLWLNGFHSPFFDQVMWIISVKWTWVPLYLLIIAGIFVKFRKEGFWALLAFIVLIAITDQVTSGLLKPLVGRLRPCHDPELEGLVHNVKRCGGQYSFVSGHASNSFAIAMFTFMLFRLVFNGVWILFIWAALVAYSRVYLGVHFPADILLGGGIGMLFAWIVFLVLRKWVPHFRSFSQ